MPRAFKFSTLLIFGTLVLAGCMDPPPQKEAPVAPPVEAPVEVKGPAGDCGNWELRFTEWPAATVAQGQGTQEAAQARCQEKLTTVVYNYATKCPLGCVADYTNIEELLKQAEPKTTTPGIVSCGFGHLALQQNPRLVRISGPCNGTRQQPPPPEPDAPAEPEKPKTPTPPKTPKKVVSGDCGTWTVRGKTLKVTVTKNKNASITAAQEACRQALLAKKDSIPPHAAAECKQGCVPGKPLSITSDDIAVESLHASYATKTASITCWNKKDLEGPCVPKPVPPPPPQEPDHSTITTPEQPKVITTPPTITTTPSPPPPVQEQPVSQEPPPTKTRPTDIPENIPPDNQTPSP